MREWLDGLDEETRAQVRALAALVLGTDSRVEHAVKWGRLTFAVDGDWPHWVCASPRRPGARGWCSTKVCCSTTPKGC
ncbi:hypothetical protein [Saccharopolyspora erythraea]|nr:hypothetical protein [Saccharopolyspora erythraea]